MYHKIKKNILKKIFVIKVFSLIVFIAMIVFFISNNLTQQKTDLIFDKKLRMHSQELQSDIKNLIDNKKEMTLTIALSLAQESNLKKALIEKDKKYLELKKFSSKLSLQTSFKNVWFHIMDKEGISFYRSWIDKKGDSLYNIRLDVQKMIQKPQIISSISVGIFDMTFKTMVPIFDKGEFIGIFEIITHFNSIIKHLSQNDLGAIALVNKKYTPQLTKAFTKTFLDDYYIANVGANISLLNYMKEKGVSTFFNNKSPYVLDKDLQKLITFYNIPDIHGYPMATIIVFKDIATINIDDIEIIRNNIIFYSLLFVILIGISGYYLVVQEYSKKLNEKVIDRTKQLHNEKSYIQNILDTNPSIILVMENTNLLRVNKSFLDFFQYKSLSSFKKENKSICDFFISINEIEFPQDRILDGKLWSLSLTQHNTKNNVVKLQFKNEIFFFTINALNMRSNEILITMQNITELRNKEQLLYQQSKMASLGEMIGNIAHQWRQPLSMISTGATGMLAKKEFSILTDDDFEKICKSINTNAQYLSQTIDDFKNFIQGDSVPVQFNLKNTLHEFLNIVDSSIKKHEIQISTNIQEDIQLYSFPNELIQCFINIFNNSKDALAESKNTKNRYLFISLTRDNKNAVLQFKDNAKGIPENIINNIFEPYFTTKHKSQGTGLGLHMTYNLIVNAMNGDIKVSNIEYNYNDELQKGACFTITIPLK